jgi:integrase
MKSAFFVKPHGCSGCPGRCQRRPARPWLNGTVAALCFFFIQTLDRPDLSRKLIRLCYPRKLPSVLSAEKVARLLSATKCLKHRAALSVAYGAGLRVAEVASLKVGDIDSARMLIRVERMPHGGAWRPCRGLRRLRPSAHRV